MTPQIRNLLLHGPMVALVVLGCAVITLLISCSSPATVQHARPAYVIALHGGAGGNQAPEDEAVRRATLLEALRAGEAILQTNGPALEAVVAAIRILEDAPWFNAGRGAVLNEEGFAEMDAALMDGANRKAGAVAAVQRVKNPILAARAAQRLAELDRLPWRV